MKQHFCQNVVKTADYTKQLKHIFNYRMCLELLVYASGALLNKIKSIFLFTKNPNYTIIAPISQAIGITRILRGGVFIPISLTSESGIATHAHSRSYKTFSQDWCCVEEKLKGPLCFTNAAAPSFRDLCGITDGCHDLAICH